MTILAETIAPGFVVGPLVHFAPVLRQQDGHLLSIEERKAALRDAAASIVERLHTLLQVAGTEEADDLFFEAGLFEPGGFLPAIERRLDSGETLRAAIHDVFTRSAEDHRAVGDEACVSHAGLIDVARQRLEETLFPPGAPFDMPPPPAVILARDITPQELLGLDWKDGHGLILETCAPNGHLAGIIRDLGIPAVSGPAVSDLLSAGTICIDARGGRIALDPDGETIETMRKTEAEARRLFAIEEDLAAKPALLPDGERVEVYLSLNDLTGLENADPDAFDGVGLVRSEFLFQSGRLIGNEDIQVSVFEQIMSWAGEKPVAIRLFDAAPDKVIPGVTDRYGDRLSGELGLRGVRFLLKEQNILKTQIRALLRSAGDREITAIVPMVTVPQEIEAVRRCRDEAARDLNIPADRVRIGMMAEVPAAALALEMFGATAFAVGLSDLTQYMTAAGREIPEVSSVADPLHPGVMNTVARAMTAARETGKPLWVCGSRVTDEPVVRALLDAGVRRISVPPASVGLVKRIISEHKTMNEA